MRKISIGFISPYDAMVPMIEELKQEHVDLEIVAKVGNLDKGLELAYELEQQGTDIIISRGGTASLIRESIALPVIDVHISGYDLLRSIMLASGHSKEKKALVGFSNITLGARSIVSLLDIELEVVTITHASEVEPILAELKAKGFTRILGDVVTINAATEFGLNGLLIQSGREAILESLEEARRLFKSQQKNQQLLRIMRQVLKKREQDVLIATEEGQVLFENWTSFKSTPLTKKEMADLYKQSAHEKSSILKNFYDGEQPYSVRIDTFSDRDGKVISFFFKRLFDSVQKFNGVIIEEVNYLPSLVAESIEMKAIKQLLEKPVLGNKPLVLIGKPGTGKQSLARYVHAYHRKKGAFVVLPVNVLGDVLEEIASLQMSTLVLEFPSHANHTAMCKIPELLSIVEGGNVQLIFSFPDSTSISLEEAGIQEAFTITLPELADRQDDIDFLVRQFLTEFHQTFGTQAVKLRDDAMDELKKMRWSGNLDELKAYVKKLAVIEKDYVIEKSALLKVPNDSPVHQNEGGLTFDKTDTLKEIEKKVIEHILKEEEFNQTKAAKRLGINRATLWRKLKE